MRAPKLPALTEAVSLFFRPTKYPRPRDARRVLPDDDELEFQDLVPNSIVVSRGCPIPATSDKEAFFEGGRGFYTQRVDEALAGGPNRRKQDEAMRRRPHGIAQAGMYFDQDSYASNENAINRNAALVFLLAAADR